MSNCYGASVHWGTLPVCRTVAGARWSHTGPALLSVNLRMILCIRPLANFATGESAVVSIVFGVLLGMVWVFAADNIDNPRTPQMFANAWPYFVASVALICHGAATLRAQRDRERQTELLDEMCGALAKATKSPRARVEKS